MMQHATVSGIAVNVLAFSSTMVDHAHPDGDQTEEYLLRRIRAGEVDRYADVMRLHQGHVARIVGRRVPPDRVEELVQDVFVRAYFGLSQFSGTVPFERWVAGIAVRACYDYWRSAERGEMPVSALTNDHQRWMDQVLAGRSDDAFRAQGRQKEAAEVLDWALGRLSPENRAVLTLVHLDGRSVREAAELLGWTVVTVKVRAHRARRALRRLLSDHLRGLHDDPR